MSSIELNFLLDALRPYSQDFTLKSDTNPFLLALNGKTYSIHTGLLHDSGESRSNHDECRIQLSRSNRDLQSSRQGDFQPLFVGFFSKSNNKHLDNIADFDGAVFSAWHPDYAFSKNDEKLGSLYSRFSHEKAALDRGAAIYNFSATKLKRRFNTLSLRSEDLGFYLENWATLHEAASASELSAALASLRMYLEPPEPGAVGRPEVTIGGRKERVTVTRTAYPRDPKFSRDVLAAYGHACAICGRQLGLVQAAHIIPHSQSDAPDKVTNGIALCAEHHKLYDDALLLPAPNQALHLNGDRVEHLKNIGQAIGLDAVESLALTKFRLPKNVAHHPNPKYLERGLNIRLGKGG